MSINILKVVPHFTASFMKLEKVNATYEGFGGGTINVDHFAVVKPDAVCVTLYDEALDAYVFVQQFRMGPERNITESNPFMIEPVAGHIDPQELPINTAVRETEEEIDATVSPSDLVYMCKGYTSPGIMSEIHHHYFAKIDSTKLNKLAAHGIDDENIRILVIPRKETLAMIDDGRIAACNTILGVSMAAMKKLVPSD